MKQFGKLSREGLRERSPSVKAIYTYRRNGEQITGYQRFWLRRESNYQQHDAVFGGDGSVLYSDHGDVT